MHMQIRVSWGETKENEDCDTITAVASVGYVSLQKYILYATMQLTKRKIFHNSFRNKSPKAQLVDC